MKYLQMIKEGWLGETKEDRVSLLIGYLGILLLTTGLIAMEALR
jgi:hypothetical protein